jgi:tRNA (guanine37-N1)-methyltransferase
MSTIKILTFKNILANSDKMDLKGLELVPSSYDIIGSREKAVAIVEIPEKLEPKEKLIAKALMKSNKNVKSVLKKISERKGKSRLRELELLAGNSNTEVIHKEYNYSLKLDPQKVYFSPREATERQRIAKQVKPNETVLVMFSGIAPFPIAIAKKQLQVNKVYGIEINKDAHEYAKENIRINKLGHKIVLICGDAREVCKNYYGKFNKVVMPLPLGAENFLDLAIKCLKKEGIIHFYSWGSEDDLFSNTLNQIKKNTKKLDKKFEILNKRKILPYKPRTFKICVEFKIKQG